MKRCVGTVVCVGVPFSVCIVDEEGEPEIAGNWGLCRVERQAIYLHADSSPAVRRFFLSHEMMHAIWTLAGVRDGLTRAKEDDNGDNVEEIFVRLVAPNVFVAEASAGKLDLR